MVDEVVVLYRDRLARIGCDLLEFIFAKVGTKLVVHGANEGEAPDKHDLADDLLAVTTLFVASYNGRRDAENKKRRRKEDKREEEKRGSKASKNVGAHDDDDDKEEEL